MVAADGNRIESKMLSEYFFILLCFLNHTWKVKKTVKEGVKRS